MFKRIRRDRGVVRVLARSSKSPEISRLSGRFGTTAILVAGVALITSCASPPQLRDVSEDSVTFVSQGAMNEEQQTMVTEDAQRACSAYGRNAVQQTPLFEGSCETPVAGDILFGPACKDDIRRHVFACVKPDADDDDADDDVDEGEKE